MPWQTAQGGCGRAAARSSQAGERPAFPVSHFKIKAARVEPFGDERNVRVCLRTLDAAVQQNLVKFNSSV